VNDRTIDFFDVIELVLNRTFTMAFPPSFQRINSKATIIKHFGNNLAKEDSKKKQKSDKNEKQEKLVVVKNNHQHKSIRVRHGRRLSSRDSRPSWDGVKTKKMCIIWHIHRECYDNCYRKESHIPKDDIPPAKVKAMCAFIAKCRGE
jgi:hypothetical protein